MKNRREQMEAFEGLLVEEFRACQAFFDLTREEWRALSASDIARLFSVAQHKEQALNHLAEMEAERRGLLQGMGGTLDCGALETEPPALASGRIEDAQRLAHLQEGILALMVQVRDMTYIHRALAFYRQQQLMDVTRQMEEVEISHLRNFVARDGANLLEVLADLYHQETAYQTVLKVNDRMLAGV
jgi:hypothetical protein